MKSIRPCVLACLSLLLAACATSSTDLTLPASHKSSESNDTINTVKANNIEDGVPSQTDIANTETAILTDGQIQVSEQIAAQREVRELDDLNQKIALASANAALGGGVSIVREDYRVGPGDVLEISVFQVEDLNKTVRVTGDGYILIPLLGAIRVVGKTTTQIQDELVAGLAKDYLHDPQVTVFVADYRSHQVAVLGAVVEPDIYNIEQPRTVLEMLSKAGGLSNESGTRIRIQRTKIDQESQLHTRESIVLDLQVLLEGSDPRLNFTLSAGDSIMVPKAGNVFVEGAVFNPGAYQIKGNTNVLKALALAGWVRFEAIKNAIQIFRQMPNGESIVHQVDLKEIRISQNNDFVLEDGDIIVVKDNSFKKGLAGFWRGLTGVFSIGTRI